MIVWSNISYIRTQTSWHLRLCYFPSTMLPYHLRGEYFSEVYNHVLLWAITVKRLLTACGVLQKNSSFVTYLVYLTCTSLITSEFLEECTGVKRDEASGPNVARFLVVPGALQGADLGVWWWAPMHLSSYFLWNICIYPFYNHVLGVYHAS